MLLALLDQCTVHSVLTRRLREAHCSLMLAVVLACSGLLMTSHVCIHNDMLHAFLKANLALQYLSALHSVLHSISHNSLHSVFHSQ